MLLWKNRTAAKTTDDKSSFFQDSCKCPIPVQATWSINPKCHLLQREADSVNDLLDVGCVWSPNPVVCGCGVDLLKKMSFIFFNKISYYRSVYYSSYICVTSDWGLRVPCWLCKSHLYLLFWFENVWPIMKALSVSLYQQATYQMESYLQAFPTCHCPKMVCLIVVCMSNILSVCFLLSNWPSNSVMSFNSSRSSLFQY